MFSAIDKRVAEFIPKLTQEEARGKDYIQYGEDNLYPFYLYDLYNDVSSLKTIINGIASYVAGDNASINLPKFGQRINRRGDTVRNFIKWVARDYNLYGGFAIQVIRNNEGGIAELYYLDFRYVRSDKKNESFIYSEEFNKKYVRTAKSLVYPRYLPDGKAPASILYVKNTISSTYPVPSYSGAIKACEIERHIDDLHLNSLENGFMSSYLINFAQGTPTPEQKSKIEKDIEEKFCGSSNAGRVILNFSNGKDNAATVEKLDIADFADKYKAAADRSREQIFCAFQAIPQLFGLMTAATGFNEQEFKEAYALFSSTVIRDQQRVIGDAIDQIFQTQGALTIKPFTLTDNQTNVN